MKAIEIGGRTYTWSELSQPAVRRQLLPQVEKLIAEFKHDPARLASLGFTPADLKAAIIWTTGQYGGFNEEQLYDAVQPLAAEAQAPEAPEGEKDVATKLTPDPNAPIDGKTAFRELGDLMTRPEMRIALRRRENGQSLDAAQKALIQRHDDLLSANNQQARLERPPTGGRLKGTDLYNPSHITDIAKLPAHEQAHRTREEAAKLRNDPRYTDANHLEHRQAVHEMELLYQGQYFEDGTPVLGDE